ncbi:hypothetical protein ACFOWA_19050 [Pedobacter lithocola]|uniref:PH domain-containing protein n=1 Tax=Pedobacter lithocola TaxID=1908239 RepID=A0ABV8PDC5_9SPHI
MIEENTEVFVVKTALIFWQNLIFLITFFIIEFGLMTTFHPKNIGYILLIFAGALAAGYALSGIAKSKAKIYFKDGKIVIEQDNSFIKRGVDMTFDLNDLRGFEVGEVNTRYDTSLILYKKDFSTYRYLLANTKESGKLKNFLAQHLPLITAKSNPKFNSFKKAFWFALINILILFLFTTLVFSVISLFNNSNNFLLALTIGLLIALLFWHFVTKKSLKRNYFRLSSTSILILLFPVIAVILLFPTIKCLNELTNKPQSILYPKEVFLHKNEKFFYIKNIQGSLDNIIASYKVGTNSRKSSVFPVAHYIETRAIDLNNNFDNVWLRKESEQKISKSISTEGRTFLITEFQQKAQKDFEHMLKNKASFYRVILIRMDNTPLAILEPYYTSLRSYKIDVQKQLVYFIGGILLLLGIGSCIIAFHR